MKKSVVALVLLLLGACASETGDRAELPIVDACSVDGIATLMAGNDAIDCGRDVEERDRMILSCAAEAFAAGQPFHAAIELQGIDSIVTELWIGTPDGAVFHVVHDSDPCGAGVGCGPAVHVAPCQEPSVDAGLFRCLQAGPLLTRTCD